jgi:hypothetical protein
MSSDNSRQSYVASGTINPATFVKLDASNNQQVLACGAGDDAWGVSQYWGDAPTFSDSTLPIPAATIGQSLLVYTLAALAQITLGTGGATNGAYLKADANANGVVTTTSGDKYGARALAAGSAGDVIPCEVVFGAIH